MTMTLWEKMFAVVIMKNYTPFLLQRDESSYANAVIVISFCEHFITFQKSFHFHGTESEQRKITVICNTA